MLDDNDYFWVEGLNLTAHKNGDNFPLEKKKTKLLSIRYVLFFKLIVLSDAIAALQAKTRVVERKMQDVHSLVPKVPQITKLLLFAFCSTYLFQWLRYFSRKLPKIDYLWYYTKK